MKTLLLFTLLLFVSLASRAQVEKADINELLFQQGGLLYEHAEYGVSIGVIEGNKIFFISSGRRMGAKLPVDNNTVFEVGPVTKTFTGLLLAQQIILGRIKQNSYIDAYLPPRFSLSARLRNKIKLTDLASYQSGLPNLINDSYIQDLLKQNPEQPYSGVSASYVYQLLSNTQKLNSYGSYEYNNYAYALLGLLLQNANKQTYAQLLQTYALNPFRFTHTSLNQYIGKNIAGRFSMEGKPEPAIILNALAPAGGLRSNAVDMVKYLQLQLNPPRAAVGKAIRLTQQPFYSDKKHKVGLGWDVYPHYSEITGSTLGNSSLLRFDVRHHLGIVVLSDHHDAKLVEDIADAVFKQLDKED